MICGMAKELIWSYVHSGSHSFFPVLCPILVYIFKDDRVKDDLKEKKNPISERKEVGETLKVFENKGLLRIHGLHSEGKIGE
jgi:hypothetical protein